MVGAGLVGAGQVGAGRKAGIQILVAVANIQLQTLKTEVGIQILVAVANIQMQRLKTKVENHSNQRTLHQVICLVAVDNIQMQTLKTEVENQGSLQILHQVICLMPGGHIEAKHHCMRTAHQCRYPHEQLYHIKRLIIRIWVFFVVLILKL